MAGASLAMFRRALHDERISSRAYTLRVDENWILCGHCGLSRQNACIRAGRKESQDISERGLEGDQSLREQTRLKPPTSTDLRLQWWLKVCQAVISSMCEPSLFMKPTACCIFYQSSSRLHETTEFKHLTKRLQQLLG